MQNCQFACVILFPSPLLMLVLSLSVSQSTPGIMAQDAMLALAVFLPLPPSVCLWACSPSASAKLALFPSVRLSVHLSVCVCGHCSSSATTTALSMSLSQCTVQ